MALLLLHSVSYKCFKTLAVWTRDQNETFHLRNFTRISITHNYTLARVFCAEHSLSIEDYLPVSNDDIMGVVLPSVNPIPVIGLGGETDILEYRSDQNLKSTMYNSQTETSAIMHVEAVIGKQNSRHYENILPTYIFFVETATPIITSTETNTESSLYSTTVGSSVSTTGKSP